MSAPATKPNDTLLWVSLIVFGVVGLSVGKFFRPGPIAEAYVSVTTEVRTLVEEVPAANEAAAKPADGAAAEPVTGSTPPKRIWVDTDDPAIERQLKEGTLKRVPDVAQAVWDVRTPIDNAATAREQMASLENEAEKLSAPTDSTGLTKEEFDQREAARTAALKVVEEKRIVSSPRDSIGIWVGALLTLGILSFLVRDNPFYKVVESILIGVSAAYWMLVAFWSTLVPDLLAKLAPDLVRATMLPGLAQSEDPTQDFLLALIPLGLAIMLLWRLMPKGGWIAVWPLAVVIGTFAGMRLTATIEADFMAQIAAAMEPMAAFTTVPPDEAAIAAAQAAGTAPSPGREFNFGGTLAAILGLIGVVTVLIYFFFSLEHKGVVGKTARVGVWFLMITFGAAFGLTVMGRMTLLIGRFEFLFGDWLNVVK
ncbi:MAG: hypothetical protein LW806_11420 [Planctomycetaceae bacterium]|nr:hypothetical protein [Planctomycetaceae bacterium]